MVRDGYAGWDDKFIPLYREFGITHFANLTNRMRKGFEEGVLLEGSLSSFGKYGKKVFILVSVDPPEDDDSAAWIWKRMEPHFDYESDGAGLLVDGRLVQTFARKCDPDELVVWRWAGRGDGTVARSWTQTQTGLCVTAAVLPPTTSSPVRFETMPRSDYLPWLTGGSRPIIRSDWDVYLVEDRLIYVKDQCSLEDAEPTFFLHLDPVDVNDLPIHRKQYGFDNLDFAFGNHRLPIEGEVCAAVRELPDYAIAAIRTGQFTSEGKIWEGRFDVVEPADDGNAAP